MFRIRNQAQNELIAERVDRASTLWARLKGLLDRRELPDGCGLWIDPCASVHTFFMRFAIDAVFLSKEHQVVRVYENLRPFRLTGWVPRARSVLELPTGSVQKFTIDVGDVLTLEALT